LAFQSVCQHAPTDAACFTAQARLGQVRLQAAEQAQKRNEMVEAQRYAILALVSPEESTRQKASELLTSDALKQGLVASQGRQEPGPGKRGGDADEKRLRALIKEADTFLYVFAAAEKKRVAFDTCLDRTGDNPTGELLTNLCREEIYKDTSEDGYRTRYTKERTDEFQWRRVLRDFHDDALAQTYKQKKTKAITDAKAIAERAGAQL